MGQGVVSDVAQKTAQKEEYYQIPVNLYQPDELIHQDLFLLYQGNYILYRPKNLRWNDTDLSQLEKFGVRSLYIRCKTKEEANHFLECNLSRILQEPKITHSEKAQIVFDTSNAIIEDIFRKPNSPEKVKRSVEFVRNSLDYLREHENFVELMRMASQDFNEYTHAIQTSAYAVSLARAMGMKSFNELAAIGIGSILHDIGKVKIDIRILDKGDSLNDDEKTEVQRHPEYGYELLRKQRSIPEEAEVIVLQHHERPTGGGYPYGLREDIHLGSKIVSLVDCFDSLTSNRPYKKKLSGVNALKLMRTELKNEYDQKLLIEFIKILGVKA
jgi:putative nucleotidyltransferase with HDIG domain